MDDSKKKNYAVLSETDTTLSHNQLLKEIQAAKLRENKFYPCCGDYIKRFMEQGPQAYPFSDHLSSAYLPVDPECRTKMCQWFYQVVHYCQLSRSAVQVCMNILDRFLSISPSFLKDRQLYQLVSIAALYLSIKIHDSVEMNMHFLGLMCRGRYHRKDIFAMERVILDRLGWRINPPCCCFFVEQYLGVIVSLSSSFLSRKCSLRKEQINLIERLTTSQTELSIMDYSICCSNERYKSSEIAFACLLNSLQVLFCNSPSNFGILELKAFFIATYYGVSSKQCLSEETERIKLLRGIILDAHIICFGCSLENIAKEWMLKLESAATALSSPSTAEKREQHVEGSINDVSNDSPHQESHHYRRKDDRTDTPISVQF